MQSNQYSSDPISSPPLVTELILCCRNEVCFFCHYQPPLFLCFSPFFWISFWSLTVIFLEFYCLITSIMHLLPVCYFLLQTVRSSSCQCMFSVQVTHCCFVYVEFWHRVPTYTLEDSLSSSARSSLLKGAELCHVLPGRSHFWREDVCPPLIDGIWRHGRCLGRNRWLVCI